MLQHVRGPIRVRDLQVRVQMSQGQGSGVRHHWVSGNWSLTFSFLLALNFFRHSTVSCLCIMEATVERCCKHSQQIQSIHTVTTHVRASVCVCVTPTHIQGCFKASEAVTLLAGLIVSILLIKSLASGVTVSHSGDGNWDSGQFYRSHTRMKTFRFYSLVFV